jgi:hypothetical protein
MSRFVRKHTRKLAVVENLEDPGRHRDSCLLRAASGGERVRLG